MLRPLIAVLSAARTRLLPALLTALGVVLVTAGLLSYADPTTAGTALVESPTSVEISPSGVPTFSFEATASPSDEPSESPGASPSPTPSGPAVATRVVVPALNIDLPIVPGPDAYPLCNVAMYITSSDFHQPGEGKATYLYAHARDGMFGPIYELAIVKHQPQKMLGMIVQVYTSDNKLYQYEVVHVYLHQLTLDAAAGATTEQLWLQTSEGPKGTPGKTQLKAVPLLVTDADPSDAHPKAHPVVCG